jgi:flagellar protein FlgJ
MTTPVGGGGPLPSVRAVTAPGGKDDQLRKTALQLEGLFVQRLFAAMRATVPKDGIVSAGNAESIFTDMFDASLAEHAPEQWQGNGIGHKSLADAIYRQLKGISGT